MSLPRSAACFLGVRLTRLLCAPSVCIAFTGFYLSNPVEFIIYYPTERTSRKPTSSPSMGKEFVTDEHNEKRRDDDASENKLATDGRDARSLAPDVVP
jgi:hypothetical protein